MATKKQGPDVDAPAAGYLWASGLQIPDRCRTARDRIAFVHDLRRTRMAEMAADAARHGEEITVWYDDLRIGGRGQVRSRAAEFERAGVDARRGRVRAFYAASLDGLFPGLERQELWLAEMEELGVTVRLRHLPHPADEATRALVRQQLGSIKDYLSARKGEAIRATLQKTVQQGRWVGRMQSQWGLRYDQATKALIFDPDTADLIRLVFEAYVEAGGVAERAADALNRMVADGHPRATRTPWDTDWKPGLVLFQVRCPLYRRRIVYGDTVLDAPDRIPEAVPMGLVAETDRLLAARQPLYDALSKAHRADLPPLTYLGLLRCDSCGSVMRSVKSCDADKHADGRWVAWRCSKGHRKGGCTVTMTVRQSRLDVLFAEGITAAYAGHCPAKARAPGAGSGRDGDDVDAPTGLSAKAEWIWSAPADPLRDADRRAFLVHEGITARVHISAREAAHTYNAAKARPTGGPVTLTIEIPRLGLTGESALSFPESEEAYRASRRGRNAPREGPGEGASAPPPRPRPRKAGRNLTDADEGAVASAQDIARPNGGESGMKPGGG